MSEPLKCPYCGSEVKEQQALTECPECGRDGCIEKADGTPGCMPGGRNCLCPQCEDGDEQSSACYLPMNAWRTSGEQVPGAGG